MTGQDQPIAYDHFRNSILPRIHVRSSHRFAAAGSDPAAAFLSSLPPSLSAIRGIVAVETTRLRPVALVPPMNSQCSSSFASRIPECDPSIANPSLCPSGSRSGNDLPTSVRCPRNPATRPLRTLTSQSRAPPTATQRTAFRSNSPKTGQKHWDPGESEKSPEIYPDCLK